VFARIRERIILHAAQGGGGDDPARPDIIEGDYETIDPDRRGTSGWTRH